ncbi:fimbrial biogenesis chaperone [Pseudomonas defluvii]|uniref:molecular chaperone n=1 Tax=Pseudomonas defluvii TaxID=1876757 RepID=UPI003905E691
MIKRQLWAALLLSQACVVQAMPELYVGTVYDYLGAERSTMQKRLNNIGSSTAFVSVSVAEMRFGRDDEVQETPLDGQDSAQRALVVTPSRLIIPADGMQNVRLLFRGDRAVERYFRLRFKPVLPKGDDEFALSKEEAAQYQKTLAADVNVLKGFGTVLLVAPSNARYATVLDDQPRVFRVRNNGTASVVLESFKDCDGKGEQCTAPYTYHVRPGKVREFTKQAGRTYQFELREGEALKPYALKG